MPMLEALGIRVRFGPTLAVDDVDLNVDHGEIVGLIGPNGAGKTTTFNAICGVQTCRGRVVLDGTDISDAPAHARAAAGMNRTFQRLEVFGSMTAYENVLTGAEIAAQAKRSSRRDARSLARELVDRVGIGSIADRRADALPTGQARLVELARALASRPKIVLLDEPASGLDERETHRLASVLRELSAEGLSVLIVEHDIELVMSLCTRVFVLDLGRVIADGEPEQVRGDERVREAYLGNAA